jgi:hypothetical protein
MKQRTGILGLLAVGLCFSAAASAQTQVVTLSSGQLTTITPEDTTEAKVFVLAVPVPAAPAGSMLMSAMLELVVDAAVAPSLAEQMSMVTLEVAPLSGALAGPAVTAADLRPTTMKRLVAVGAEKTVRVDVTEFVRYVLDNPEENYGLAVGSLSGARVGRFDVKAEGQQVATLTVHYLPAATGPAVTP